MIQLYRRRKHYLPPLGRGHYAVRCERGL